MLSATLLTSALAEAVHWAGGSSTVGAGVGVGTAAGCVGNVSTMGCHLMQYYGCKPAVPLWQS